MHEGSEWLLEYPPPLGGVVQDGGAFVKGICWKSGFEWACSSTKIEDSTSRIVPLPQDALGGGGGQPCESHMSVTEKQTTKLARGEGCHHRVGVHNDGHGARGV